VGFPPTIASDTERLCSSKGHLLVSLNDDRMLDHGGTSRGRGQPVHSSLMTSSVSSSSYLALITWTSWLWLMAHTFFNALVVMLRQIAVSRAQNRILAVHLLKFRDGMRRSMGISACSILVPPVVALTWFNSLVFGLIYTISSIPAASYKFRLWLCRNLPAGTRATAEGTPCFFLFLCRFFKMT
jgi:hypothetical protein